MPAPLPPPPRRRSLYLRLQRVYRERAERDVAAVEGHVNAILGCLGRDAGAAGMGRDVVRHYCKHARTLRCVRCGGAGPRLFLSGHALGGCVLAACAAPGGRGRGVTCWCRDCGRGHLRGPCSSLVFTQSAPCNHMPTNPLASSQPTNNQVTDP